MGDSVPGGNSGAPQHSRICPDHWHGSLPLASDEAYDVGISWNKFGICFNKMMMSVSVRSIFLYKMTKNTKTGCIDFALVVNSCKSQNELTE